MNIKFKLTAEDNNICFIFRDIDDKSGHRDVFVFSEPKEVLEFFKKYCKE